MMFTPPFSNYIIDVAPVPGLPHRFGESWLESFRRATDEDLRRCILMTSSTTWHYSCTCRMGAADAPADQAVCDPRLRVKGVRGLRVADCSVLPFVVSGNTNAVCLMVGDKCGEMILADHSLTTNQT